VDGQAPAQKFQLIVADADGENQRLGSNRATRSCHFVSPMDSGWLTCRSRTRSRLSTCSWCARESGGKSRARGNQRGSRVVPDGKKARVDLGRQQRNPDIYVLELQSQTLTRITDDPAIDTEGRGLRRQDVVFHVRSRGRPQIYRIGVNRVTGPSGSLSAQLQCAATSVCRWNPACDGDSRHGNTASQ